MEHSFRERHTEVEKVLWVLCVFVTAFGSTDKLILGENPFFSEKWWNRYQLDVYRDRNYVFKKLYVEATLYPAGRRFL